METVFARRAREQPFSSEQMSLIVGSLLGDGHLMRSTARFCFRVHHGLAQRDYVRWKFALLHNFVRTAPRAARNGFYFRTVAHPTLSELSTAFYGGGKKVVPFDLLEHAFDPLSRCRLRSGSWTTALPTEDRCASTLSASRTGKRSNYAGSCTVAST